MLLKADKATVTLEALKDGKIRVTSTSWAEAVIILPGEMLEAKWGAGQVNLFRDSRPTEPPKPEPAKDFEEFV